MRILLLLLGINLCAICSGQENSLPDNVSTYINERIEAGMNPSIAVGIIDKNGTRYFSFGKTKSGGKKINEHTIYELGSISKTFTGILLADMVLRGELEVDDPVEKYLPASVDIVEKDGTQITLGHLSDHTSGLPRLPDNMDPADPANPYADYTVEKLYEFLSGFQLNRPAGSGYEYSNLGAGLLGHILSLKANKRYEELVISTIAKPLGMEETRISLTPAMKKNLAVGHDQSLEVKNWDLSSLEGAGAIRSSVHDMLIYLKANMCLMDHPLQAAMKLSHMTRHDKAGGGMKLGLGWHILPTATGEIVWHNGGTGGYSTFAGFNKETGVGVVVLTNSTERVDDLGFHLLDQNLPLGEVKPHIAAPIREFIEEEGHENLQAKFRELKKEFPTKYDFSEQGINALGYYYLNRKMYDEALAVFQLNINEYPSSANVYDSYAEALKENGDKENAILNYKKSLEINPGNTNAIEMLAEMGVTYEAAVPEISEKILQSYIGTYELVPGFEITINLEDKQLIAQATSQGAYPIFPKTENEFYYKVVDAQIVFNRNDHGEVKSLTLFQSGRKIEGKKLK